MLSKIWNYISQIGVDASNSISTNKRIILSNQTAIIIVIAFFISSISDYSAGIFFTSSISFLCGLGCVFIPFLNKSKLNNYTFTIIIFFLSINLFITDGYLGFNAANFIFYFPMILIAAFLGDFDHKFRFFCQISIPAIFTILSLVTNHSLLLNKEISISQIEVNRISNFVICTIVSILLGYIIRKLYFKSDYDLAEENKTLKQIFDNSADAHFVVDLHSENIVDCNQRALDYFEFTQKDSIIGTKIFLLEKNPLSEAEIQKLIKEIRNKKTIKRDVEYFTSSGRTFWAKLAATFFEKGGTEYLIVRLSDNTIEHKAITKVEESELRLNLIIENCDLHIWFIDKKFELLKFNQNFKRAFDKRYRTYIKLGDNILKLNNETSQKEWGALYKRAFEGEQFTVEYKDGDEYFEISFYPLSNVKEVFAISIMAKDITSRKELENELKEAKVMSENATLAKTNFLSNMSHEIRTPLNAIVGISYLLKDNINNIDKSEKINILQYSSEQLLSIVNNILDYNKLEDGKSKIEYAPFNVSIVLSNAKDLFTDFAKSNNNEIIISVDNKIPETIIGDETKLGQILNNLISNAIKFTENGKIEIIAKAKEIIQNKIIVSFEVKDNGIGIAAEKQQNIFERFSTLSENTKYTSTGLGLSITKKLVELLGGNIELKSDSNKGSSFVFELACLLNENNITEESKPTPKSEILQNKRILVVDDSQYNIYVTQRFLQIWDMQIETAQSGAEAIEMVKKHKFDIILMDLQMPEMDGYEASRVIHQIDNEVHIIALTAFVESEIKENMSQNIQFKDYLIKPFHPDILKKKLEQILV